MYFPNPQLMSHIHVRKIENNNSIHNNLAEYYHRITHTQTYIRIILFCYLKFINFPAVKKCYSSYEFFKLLFISEKKILMSHV